MNRNGKVSHPAPTVVRCAVYTRKSTEEGLEQAFNSLDAQREAGEAYIASQRAEDWHCLPDRYDDGGFTGGNTDRPALQRLLSDIEAGRVDCVVVYKVDRLSRSLLDFTKLMEAFDRQRVSFVSVTQQFNTATSMGRLVLNVLLSFAQFEREIISERTRDKIAAMRKKGKWAGGLPPLGYDVESGTSRLVVNADEAVNGRFALADVTGRVIVHGHDGADVIAVSAQLPRPADLFGNDGNDWLVGGSGNDLLVGGVGRDRIAGKDGRDVVFGGAGADQLGGGNGDDLLVAGPTDFDADPDRLADVIREWTSADPHMLRVTHLTEGQGGLNASTVLTATTVHDDSAADLLAGGPGPDWLIWSRGDVLLDLPIGTRTRV